ncbi:MAG: Spy/CpxP family protein refolding chaperone [Massilia sp.]|nr:Spy/CpxP family protein refolding chaperone [Massilia sp.]
MRTLRKHVLIALTILGMGSAAVLAQAQTPTQAPTQAAAPEGRHGHAAQQQERMAQWGEHAAKRQAKLHDALKLSAAQEPAWTAFQAAIKPDAAAMAMQGDRAVWASMSAPARMEKMIDMAKQHTARMESHLAALNTFYAVLTPAQKQVFDAQAKGGRGHHRDGHMKGAPHAG